MESVRYRTGGLDTPGRHEKVPLRLPPSVDIAPVAAGQTLSDLLAAGEIDAVYSPRAPRTHGAGRVRRLFTDTRAEEERYYAETGIFPLMHVVVIRRDVYQANRWLPRELFKAFTAAKRIAYEELARTAALSVSLPFAREEFEAAAAMMGGDYWAYGIEPNRRALETFAGYAAAQHLIARPPAPEELFAAELREDVVI